jgi:hypothetical protein
MAVDPTPIPAPTPASGFGTSEFWLNLIVVIANAVLNSGQLPQASVAFKVIFAAVSVLTAILYTAQRTSLKKAALKVARS